MGGVAGSSREGEGEGKVKSKETSAARLLKLVYGNMMLLL